MIENFLISIGPFLFIIINHTVSHHHHRHRQPWAQHPLVSDAIVTIAAHRCLSKAAWLNSCRVAPHHCSMSSDHSRWGRPLLFEPSIIPNTRVFIFLLSFILQIWPKRRNFLFLHFLQYGFCQLNFSVQFFISDLLCPSYLSAGK